MAEREDGTVKSFDDRVGLGWIKREFVGGDIAFSSNDISVRSSSAHPSGCDSRSIWESFGCVTVTGERIEDLERRTACHVFDLADSRRVEGSRCGSFVRTGRLDGVCSVI